eukprot:6147955-Pyramimonas_sp.AAC.1
MSVAPVDSHAQTSTLATRSLVQACPLQNQVRTDDVTILLCREVGVPVYDRPFASLRIDTSQLASKSSSRRPSSSPPTPPVSSR